MKYLKNQKPLVIFLSALLFFAACKKDSDSAPGPTTEPLTVAAAKPGDLIIIKGQNFSEEVANNTVSFNGVTVTPIIATATELKVVVPAGASSGNITVTVNGKTIAAGSLTIAPLTLYSIKENVQDYNNPIRELVAIDPANGKEALVLPFSDLPDSYLQQIVFLAATNEIAGVNDAQSELLRINVATKKVTTLTLTTSQSIEFTHLITDKNNNLYAIKIDWTQPNYPVQSLVQINYKTGNITTLITFPTNNYITEIELLPSGNEIAGLGGYDKLFKVNLNTKDTSSAPLTNSAYVNIHDLVTDYQHMNLYAYKVEYSSGSGVPAAQVVYINPFSGWQNTITTLSDDRLVYGTFTYLPERYEIAGIWDDTNLFRFNTSTKATSTLPLTTQQQIMYRELITN